MLGLPTNGGNVTYYPGRYFQICDICGLRGYNTEMVKNWKNQIVHKETCHDGPRDPLDFPPRVRHERNRVLNVRKESALTPTIISTTKPSLITSESATSGGNVTNDGGASVTAYGVCWSTETAPAINDDHTVDGTGTGEFTSDITALTNNTKYFIRSYATNSAGTSYGPTQELTTLP